MPSKSYVITKDQSLFSFKELTAYKELFWMLAWRDFKIRYAQTFVGLLWAFIQPSMTILILYVVFGRFANVQTGIIPHIVYSTCGVMAWTYFSYVMTNAGNSIISAQAMVKKIYFPRIIIPLSKAVVGFIDMGITALILAVLMIVFEVPLSGNVVYLPLFVLASIVAALSVGILLSALTIRYRDFQYVIPFAVQLGLYITPTAYPAEFAINRLPEWAAILYFLNPMAGIVEGYRWAILGTELPHLMSLWSVASMLIILVVALFYFKRIDGKIADYV
ncbi:MAG: ABC transporter permease [Cryomorphaceae bacterium]